MKIAERTIGAIQKIITGDPLKDGKTVGPYQSGPTLVEFFNELGFNDSYPRAGGFPSRWMYCEDKLRELNDTDRMTDAIELALDPQRFMDTGIDLGMTIEYINKYLKFDGYEVRASNDRFRVFKSGETVIELKPDLPEADPTSREFIQEQITKCRKKLDADDFDGAITNARSLIEAVLVELERRLDNEPPKYDGDLTRLYKRVRKLMNLDPKAREVDEILGQILTGLTSVVSGLAATRNRMSDAHARTCRPDRHHARLAVNAANTLVDFLLESYALRLTKDLKAPATKAMDG